LTGPASTQVELSVVIPFKDAARSFRDQLEALAAQGFEGEWEVVLVDNGSRDEPRSIGESFADRLNLRIFDARDRPRAVYATNVGVRHSSGKKLIFVDADDVIAPGYIAAIAAALDRHDFVTSAFDHVALNAEWLHTAHGPVCRDPEDPLFVQSGVLPFAGGSIGISRSVFEAVGGFPENFPRMQDIAFSWEVQFAGTRLHYVPEALYHVRYRETLRELFRQGFAGSSSAPLLYRHYRHAGMGRRSVPEVVRSWLRLVRRVAAVRSRADIAPLVVELGRQLGRLRGSLRYRVFFP
jgi:glycosyltransferase involved in cell wall biosynthesis